MHAPIPYDDLLQGARRRRDAVLRELSRATGVPVPRITDADQRAAAFLHDLCSLVELGGVAALQRTEDTRR